MRRVFRATALVVILFAARAAVAAVSEGSSGELRDIRGPSPPSGLPPFTASTALVVLAAAGVAISRLKSSKNGETLSVPASGTLADELLSLRNAYEKGELPDWLLFDRLSPLVRAMLPCDDHSVLTSGELVAAARGIVPEELFEEPAACLSRLNEAGIPIAKVQASSAIRLVDPDCDLLRGYVEPCYLHQVVIRRPDGTLLRYSDLPEALTSHQRESGDEWRCHFHVPIFLPGTGTPGTTRRFIDELLPLLPKGILLEVETYTWDVLPPELRSGTVTDSIIREITWLKEQTDAAHRRP